MTETVIPIIGRFYHGVWQPDVFAPMLPVRGMLMRADNTKVELHDFETGTTYPVHVTTLSVDEPDYRPVPHPSTDIRKVPCGRPDRYCGQLGGSAHCSACREG